MRINNKGRLQLFQSIYDSVATNTNEFKYVLNKCNQIMCKQWSSPLTVQNTIYGYSYSGITFHWRMLTSEQDKIGLSTVVLLCNSNLKKVFVTNGQVIFYLIGVTNCERWKSDVRQRRGRVSNGSQRFLLKNVNNY